MEGRPPGQPNLDVRLTRSQSGSILDIDFVGGPLVTASPSTSTAVVVSGRRLKILEHRVHKVELRTKETGEQEEELVVSNLRPFTLKVGVHDHLDQPMIDCSLPLRASLLYENGLPVKQTSTSEPLLVGETDVVALQGAATFKLRITSLSSHRDKQRFRIQVAPQDVEVQMREPGLCVVTDPMKSVTKLGRAAPNTSQMLPPPLPLPNDPTDYRRDDTLKRKYQDALESHAQQLQTLGETQAHIMRELQSLLSLAHQRALNGGAPLLTAKQEQGIATRRAAGAGH